MMPKNFMQHNLRINPLKIFLHLHPHNSQRKTNNSRNVHEFSFSPFTRNMMRGNDCEISDFDSEKGSEVKIIFDFRQNTCVRHEMDVDDEKVFHIH
jgi:hypothetical protein